MGALNIKDLGPCQVLWNSINLGPTLGGVTFKEEQHSVDIHEDGHGDTPVDAITTGKITTVTANFTRSSLTQLELMIESATKSLVTGNLKVVNSVGNAMFAASEELILKPLVDNVASILPAEWLHVHRTYPLGAPEFKFDNSAQRNIPVVFKCFPDDLSGQVGEIWRMGPAV
jgi:hypothetical protein